jgi:hypothetical protein
MDLKRERGWGGMNCIHLAQDRDQWRVVVNTITIRCWLSSRVAAQLAASQEGLSAPGR